MNHSQPEDSGKSEQNGTIHHSSPGVLHETDDGSPSPNTPTSIAYRPVSRPHRQSSTPSDQTSSRPGSDGIHRVFSWMEDGDSVQTSSDTVYDSLRTGTSRSVSGYPKRGLETLFDQSVTSLGLEAKDDPPAEAWEFNGKDHIADKDHDHTINDTSPVPGSSPAAEARLVPFIVANDIAMAEPLDEDWDAFDGDVLPGLPQILARNPQRGFSTEAQQSHAELPAVSSPKPLALKNSIFDHSEPQHGLEFDSDDDTPSRPKTVHGKDAIEARGGRSADRRKTGGMHARSQSVPATQDSTGATSDIKAKFSNWGSSYKEPVISDVWRDDEFDIEMPVASHTGVENNSHQTLVIPDYIRKANDSVIVEMSLMGDFGLRIEELKELRTRIDALGIPREHQASLFDEVDAMVELAGTKLVRIGGRSRASSVTPSEDGADTTYQPNDADIPADTPKQPGSLVVRPSDSPYQPESSLARPADTLNQPGPSVARPRSSPTEMLRVHPRSKPTKTSPRVDSPEHFTRPSKDSEAVAATVIGALQQWRNPLDSDQGSTETQDKITFDSDEASFETHDKVIFDPEEPSFETQDKVTFDTVTLKKLNPRIANLVRQLKQILHDAEGLHTSPEKLEHDDPPFSQAFINRGDESPSASKGHRLQLARGLPVAGAVSAVEEDELLSQLEMMDIS